MKTKKRNKEFTFAENKLQDFCKKAPVLKFKKGEKILRPGEIINNVYILKTGFIRVYLFSKELKEVTVKILKPNFYMPMVYSVGGQENKYYFEAMTPVEIICPPKEETLVFLKENPDVLLESLEKITFSYRELLAKIEYLISGDARTKVASLIFSCVDETKINSGELMLFPLPHRLIAGMTGLTRETVTIQLLKLEKEEIIGKRGRILTIKNLRKLKEISAFFLGTKNNRKTVF